MTYKKGILIIDSDSKLVKLLNLYLNKEEFDITSASNGNIAMELFHQTNPSLILLDLLIPDISGEAICKKIRKCSDVPIIIVTAAADEESILHGFKIGADDYITKPFSSKQLIARVHALLRRAKSTDNFTPKMLSFYDGDLTINIDKSEIRKKGNLVNLTQTEYNLLTTMIKSPYKAFTREELINNIFEVTHFVHDRVIDVHVKNLRRKIETDLKKPKYILTAHGVGYRFGGD